MRIVDESGKWDIPYDQVTIKVEKNRIYAYPFNSNIYSKPIYLCAVVNEKAGLEKLMQMRYALLSGAQIFNCSKTQMKNELQYYDTIEQK